jgi:hypothetical protein
VIFSASASIDFIPLLGQNRSITSSHIGFSFVVDPITVAHVPPPEQGGRPTFWASVVRRI